MWIHGILKYLRKASFVLGLLGMVYAVATALGPVLGGAFTQFNWTVCFWINCTFEQSTRRLSNVTHVW